MFAPTTASLVWICLVGVLVYVATAIVTISTRLRHERRMRILQRVEGWLGGQSKDGSVSPNEGRRQAQQLLARTPLGDVILLAQNAHESQPAKELLAQAVLSRLGNARVLETARTGSCWRRIAALRALAFGGSEQAHLCLERALAEGHGDVKAGTVSLLRQMGDRRSAGLLVGGLSAGSFSRSRIAAALDAFSIDIGDLIVPLLDSDDALVRFWAAALMQRYPATPDLGPRLVALASDAEPIVRKAAIDAIVAVTDSASAAGALHARLTDETPFVRAHAAIAFARLQGSLSARALMPLLADKEWLVRDAAKAGLRALGETVTPAVLPFLTHDDAFARNGAAEVLQDVGVFERLLALEASGTSSPDRVRTLRLLTRAGGAVMSAGVVDRLSAAIRPMARQVLSSMDLGTPLEEGT